MRINLTLHILAVALLLFGPWVLLVLGVQWCYRKNLLTRDSGYDRAAEQVLDARWEQDYWFDGAEIGTTDLDQFQIFRL